MPAPRRNNQQQLSSSGPGEAATSYLALCLVALLLSNALRESAATEAEMLRGRKLRGGRQPCEEIYVVGEGETLHTISDKCGDPFIVERNPHIHDPDDVYPGLVLKIATTTPGPARIT